MFNNGIGFANDYHLTKETLRMVLELPSRRWVILALMMLVLCRPRRGYKQMQQLRPTVPRQSAFRSNRSQTFFRFGVVTNYVCASPIWILRAVLFLMLAVVLQGAALMRLGGAAKCSRVGASWSSVEAGAGGVSHLIRRLVGPRLLYGGIAC